MSDVMTPQEAREHIDALTGGPSSNGVVLVSPARHRRLLDWFGDDLSWDELMTELRSVACA